MEYEAKNGVIMIIADDLFTNDSEAIHNFLYRNWIAWSTFIKPIGRLFNYSKDIKPFNDSSFMRTDIIPTNVDRYGYTLTRKYYSSAIDQFLHLTKFASKINLERLNLSDAIEKIYIIYSHSGGHEEIYKSKLLNPLTCLDKVKLIGIQRDQYFDYLLQTNIRQYKPKVIMTSVLSYVAYCTVFGQDSYNKMELIIGDNDYNKHFIEHYDKHFYTLLAEKNMSLCSMKIDY